MHELCLGNLETDESCIIFALPPLNTNYFTSLSRQALIEFPTNPQNSVTLGKYYSITFICQIPEIRKNKFDEKYIGCVAIAVNF